MLRAIGRALATLADLCRTCRNREDAADHAFAEWRQALGPVYVRGRSYEALANEDATEDD